MNEGRRTMINRSLEADGVGGTGGIITTEVQPADVLNTIRMDVHQRVAQMPSHERNRHMTNLVVTVCEGARCSLKGSPTATPNLSPFLKRAEREQLNGNSDVITGACVGCGGFDNKVVEPTK